MPLISGVRTVRSSLAHVLHEGQGAIRKRGTTMGSLLWLIIVIIVVLFVIGAVFGRNLF
jgi:hypothetical protein